MEQGAIRYTTYIRTTPTELWSALIDPGLTLQCWGDALHSDWQVGSPVLWQMGRAIEPRDTGQVVLEADPPRRLAYTWHKAQQEHAAALGWSTGQLAAIQQEPRTRVEFDIEPLGPRVKLTVVHSNFVSGSAMFDACSNSWPLIMSDLKTLLEVGTLAPSA